MSPESDQKESGQTTSFGVRKILYAGFAIYATAYCCM